MRESELLDAVLELARRLGWRTSHFRPARTQQGWRTPVQGDARGFPDLVLIRRDRLVIAELKSARGVLTPEQEGWLDAWRGLGYVHVAVWRPADWHAGTIEAALR